VLQTRLVQLSTSLIGLAVLLACTKPQRAEEPQVEPTASAAFDFLLGDWDIDMEVVPQGAPIGQRATMRAYQFLDGTAILDEWRHFDQAGDDVVFRGAGFRTFVPGTDRWYVVWMMAEVEGYSELSAEFVHGELRTTGRGRDARGQLVERGRYFDISDRAFSFTLERSYDGGTTWIRPFVAFRATRK
jgi:hypothetical protein